MKKVLVLGSTGMLGHMVYHFLDSTNKYDLYNLSFRNKLKSSKINTDSIQFLNPLGFFDYVKLQSNAFVTLSDSGTISEESAMMNFPAVSVRTSTERPEAIDSGVITIGNIDSDSLLQTTDIATKLFDSNTQELPSEYKSLNVSEKVVKIIQGYTPIVNREIWKKR